MSADYEYEFDPTERNNTAASLHQLVVQGGRRVLDLGCGPGILAGALARDGFEVVAADVREDLLAAARDRGVGATVVADLDADDWTDRLAAHGPYDTIVLADVLEHLVDPEGTLTAIRETGLLAEGGSIVISIPNASHESVIANLMVGDFRYTETGLLDRTHIRFFTLASFREMVEGAGWVVSQVRRTTRTIEQTLHKDLASRYDAEVRRRVLEGNPEHRVFQYVLRLEPSDAAGQLAAVRRELVEARSRVEELECELGEASRSLTGELESLRAELAEAKDRRREAEEALAVQQDRNARERLELGRELDELRRQLDGASDGAALRGALERERARAERAERKLGEVYESETFRVGRAILAVPRALLGRGGGPSPATSVKAPAAPRSSKGGRQRRTRATGTKAMKLDADESPRRRDYERLAARREYGDGDGPRIAFTVSTLDLDEGRGDIYTAGGIGLELERLGYRVLLVPPERWGSLPSGTDVLISMLAEPRFPFDPTIVPGEVTLVAWVRNNVQRWIAGGTLPLYDAVLCSSSASLANIRPHAQGPVGVLPIGVDTALFRPADDERRGVVSTTNQWGGLRHTFAGLLHDRPDVPLALFGNHRTLPEELEPWAAGAVSYFRIPAVYRQVELVLDDLQGVNRAYGNVNSRIFESLAAGALPVTNARLGLEELGLGEVPVVERPEDLGAQIRELLADPAALRRRADALAELVRNDHGYDRRAADLDAFIREHDLVQPAPTARATVVGFWPDYRITNPYQDMLYGSLPSARTVALPVQRPIDVLGGVAAGRLAVYHLHWTAPIIGRSQTEREATAAADAFVAELDQLRSAGVPMVWTIHNAMPHETAFPEVELELRRRIVDRVSAVHVMCERTLDALPEGLVVPAEKVRVIPHGSYVGIYPDAVDGAGVRAQLGLSESDVAVLAFGQIRPYKGLERLLDAFVRARGRVPQLRLVVAGAPGRFEGVNELLERCRTTDGVVLRAEEVPDEEVGAVVQACDVLVLPHERVLNSGAALLGLTFGRPVIAPDTGCLPSVIDAEVGRLYTGIHGLVDALASAPALLGPEMRLAARRRAEGFTPTDMADRFAELVASLSARG
ncbi:MAG: methyltransferase domain-containing protein [Actinomycetes bacterium]